MTRLLAEATTVDADGARLVLVPIGSLEQHGPHLPLDTDTAIAQAVVAGVADRLGQAGTPAWVAPPVTYAASGEHQAFAGTSSIGTDALRLLLVELVRSMRTWARRVVLVNAHGGNLEALAQAVDQLVAEGHDVSWPRARPGRSISTPATRRPRSCFISGPGRSGSSSPWPVTPGRWVRSCPT